jgi:hypothetical protein
MQAFSLVSYGPTAAPPALRIGGSERTDIRAADAVTEEEGEKGHFFGSHFCAVTRKSFR